MSESNTLLIRVTQALDHFKTDGYWKWRLRVGEREANAIGKASAKIGTRIDEVIKSQDYTILKKDSPKTKNCLNAFLKWRERYQVGTLVKLERLEDVAIGLTGEPDVLWVEDETLIDIKGTKQLWPHHFFQLGGYKRLGVPCKKAAILRLDPENGDFEYLTNDKIGLSLEDLVDAYESAYKHYRYYTYIEQYTTGEQHGHSYATEVSSNTGAVRV